MTAIAAVDVIVKCAEAAMVVVVDGGDSGRRRQRRQGARGEVDTGEGGRGREGEGEASEGERARADEGARARAMVDIWHGGRQRQATKVGVGRRGGAAA
jgi:hypothetical protein